MKTQHTPGPWRIGDAGNTVFGLPDTVPDQAPVIIAGLGKARGAKAANARLIAAAPDLLEAAKRFFEVTDVQYAANFHDLRDDIAKAQP